ncbi:MAG: hypothetical protein EA377_06875 [Phycisphaerales bacterium]|nr:MAG: hypothetical protein EA377_06875 [Phycisphaerales bacterium]
MLLVRQPMKSVRSRDLADPLPVRLALGVIIALGTVFLLWLIGTLGFTFGFARSLGMPGLQHEQGPWLGGVIFGLDMLIHLPTSILRTGLVSPLWLLLGFAMLCLPAAGLAAARPLTPGGPKPSSLTVVFSNVGAIAAGLFSVAAITWTLLPLRLEMLQPVPRVATGVEEWLETMRFVAGLDAFLVATLALWLVLAMRLAIVNWLRALIVPVVILAVLIAGLGFAVSQGSVARVLTPLPVLIDAEVAETEDQRLLLIGESSRGPVVIRRSGDGLAVRVEPTLDQSALQLLPSRSLRDFARP